MITVYCSGNELVDSNRAFLDTNPYLGVFFYLDAGLLQTTDSTNYALKCETDDHTLLAMKVEPYDLLLFGSPFCVPELTSFILQNGYELKGFLCGSEVGECMQEILTDTYGIPYYEALAMDFMEATEITEPSSEDVETAQAGDLDEICECLERFISDCGLQDQLNRENTARNIGNFRLIRKDGKIASLASAADGTSRDKRITDVYTRDEYRGQGYARKVVNTLKNEILTSGKLATLNEDKKNPVSNHLYSSIGFRRIFSQGEYRRTFTEDTI